MDKQGLVAPVWSDAGSECTFTLDFGFGTPLTVVWPAPAKSYSFEGIQWPTFDFNPPKVSTAKDALPTLTRVSGNKRGPGWCSEE